jgi:hypothetical protein
LIGVAADAYIAAMRDETKDNRLTPPAFPPGSRKQVHANSDSPPREPSSASESADVNLISPDDPMPARRKAMGSGLISPDDPMPERPHDAVFDAFISPDDPMPFRVDWGEEGVVTGMGSDPHMDPAELVTGGDPHVIELMGIVGRLAEALKRQGEAGLRAAPHMTRFEATLRSYCVGYLAGRRAEDNVESGESSFDMGLEK